MKHDLAGDQSGSDPGANAGSEYRERILGGEYGRGQRLASNH